MKKFFVLPAIIVFSAAAFAQKGVDTQTKKITNEAAKTTQSPVDTATTSNGRVLDFGKGKTPVRELLPNPYKIPSRRDVLIATVTDLLKEQKLIIDESASRPSEGIIITQPFVFAKGTVISQNELNRYAILPSTEPNWRSGRYSLRVEVQSIDGIQNNVSVTAKVDGKAENGLMSEWTTLQSSGVAEDDFLSKLVENVIGAPVNPITANPQEKP